MKTIFDRINNTDLKETKGNKHIEERGGLIRNLNNYINRSMEEKIPPDIPAKRPKRLTIPILEERPSNLTDIYICVTNIIINK